MAATDKLLTAEDLARMPEPDDGYFELVQGRLVKVPLGTPKHGHCCAKVGATMDRAVRERKLGWVCSNNTGVITERNPDTVLGPDIAFWSYERLPTLPDLFVDIVPDLAVEVFSAIETGPTVLFKLLHWLDHGVQMVWVVDPEGRIVMVHRSRQDVRILGDSEEIDGADVLPGFTCRVSELFDG
jgi:Uma2 family endonuclease